MAALPKRVCTTCLRSLVPVGAVSPKPASAFMSPRSVQVGGSPRDHPSPRTIPPLTIQSGIYETPAAELIDSALVIFRNK